MTRYGLFGYNSINYAVKLLQLKQIIHKVRGYQLPRLPAAVAEVFVDDGQLVPLLLPGLASDEEQRLACKAEYKVLVESEGGLVAFPAGETSGIIPANRCELQNSSECLIPGTLGSFTYKGKEYKILDIDFLAIELTQNTQRDEPDIDGARRHQ
jgi:hypothetical protein